MFVLLSFSSVSMIVIDMPSVSIIIVIIMPSPPTKSLDFRGFDSSRLLILKGGNSHVHIIL